MQAYTRPDWEHYYLGVAQAVSRRSSCLRRKYGVVIVKDNRIVSTGYNGAPKGVANCCDTGICVRKENKIPHGERYELCDGVHGETNAMIKASPEELQGATLYLYGYDIELGKTIDAAPCIMCERNLKNSGIEKIIGSKFDENYLS